MGKKKNIADFVGKNLILVNVDEDWEQNGSFYKYNKVDEDWEFLVNINSECIFRRFLKEENIEKIEKGKIYYKSIEPITAVYCEKQRPSGCSVFNPRYEFIKKYNIEQE